MVMLITNYFRATAICIVRLCLLARLSSIDFTCKSCCKLKMLTLTTSASVTTIKVLHFTTTELAIGIFCSSAPALRPLINPMVSRFMGNISRLQAAKGAGKLSGKTAVSPRYHEKNSTLNGTGYSTVQVEFTRQ